MFFAWIYASYQKYFLTRGENPSRPVGQLPAGGRSSPAFSVQSSKSEHVYTWLLFLLVQNYFLLYFYKVDITEDCTYVDIEQPFFVTRLPWIPFYRQRLRVQGLCFINVYRKLSYHVGLLIIYVVQVY